MNFPVDRFGESKAVIPPDVLRPIYVEDSRPFFQRLIESIRVKWSYDPKTNNLTIEAHGKADV
jgi:hypothetical protein